LQLCTGFAVGYLVYQIGTLVTEGTVGNGFLPGLIAVIVMAVILMYLCVKAERNLKKEYALSGKK
jgi:ferrous iron transport protein B